MACLAANQDMICCSLPPAGSTLKSFFQCWDADAFDGKCDYRRCAACNQDTCIDNGCTACSLEVAVASESSAILKLCPYALTPFQMNYLACSVLPPTVQHRTWKRLYSLSRDGDSFLSFLHHVEGWRRTLLVIKTTKDEVMGAYVKSPWLSAGQKYYGSAEACLWWFKSPATLDQKVRDHNEVFLDTGGACLHGDNDINIGNVDDQSISENSATFCDDVENQLIVHGWTGANYCIQVCNERSKTIAIGGGEDFGLLVEDDFQRGSTARCETFGNYALCSEKLFNVKEMECWGFPTGFT